MSAGLGSTRSGSLSASRRAGFRTARSSPRRPRSGPRAARGIARPAVGDRAIGVDRNAYRSKRAPGADLHRTLDGNLRRAARRTAGSWEGGRMGNDPRDASAHHDHRHPVSSPTPYGRVPLPSSGHQGTASMPLDPPPPTTDAATSPRRDGKASTTARRRLGAPAQAGRRSDGGPSPSPRLHRAGPAAAGTGRSAGRSSRTTTTASTATPASREPTHTTVSAVDSRSRALQQNRPQRPISAHCVTNCPQRQRGVRPKTRRDPQRRRAFFAPPRLIAQTHGTRLSHRRSRTPSAPIRYSGLVAAGAQGLGSTACRTSSRSGSALESLAIARAAPPRSRS